MQSDTLSPPPFCAQRRRNIRIRVVGRDRHCVVSGRQRGVLVEFDIPRRALPCTLGRRRFRRGRIEIELDVPDRVFTLSSGVFVTTAAVTAARERARRHSGCRGRGGRGRSGGGERVARRASTEGPLERVFEPGDLFRTKTRETLKLRRICLSDLREALCVTRSVGNKTRG